MGPGAPEIEDGRTRLLVRLTGETAGRLEASLEALCRADRLAGIIAAEATEATVGLALTLPTALLLVGTAPLEGAAGAVVDARSHPAEGLDRARRAFGRDGILLADVGVSRHAAMEAGESGADGVVFGGPFDAVCDCVAWWSELFVLPAAAESDLDGIDTLVRAGADFLLIDGAWLADGTLDPEALVSRLAAAERARAGQRRGLAQEADDDEDQR